MEGGITRAAFIDVTDVNRERSTNPEPGHLSQARSPDIVGGL